MAPLNREPDDEADDENILIAAFSPSATKIRPSTGLTATPIGRFNAASGFSSLIPSFLDSTRGVDDGYEKEKKSSL